MGLPDLKSFDVWFVTGSQQLYGPETLKLVAQHSQKIADYSFISSSIEVQAVKPTYQLPKLPAARVLWKPYPDMHTGCAAWILAGGAHHTVYSQNLTAEHLSDFADMAGIEMVLIGKNTNIYDFKNQLRWSEVYYK